MTGFNFSNIDIPVLITFSIIYLILFATAEIAFHFFKVDAEYTRKWVHLGTGIIALFFPLFIGQPLDLIILCTLFAVLLIISIRFNFLKSINAIDRVSRGSLMYPAVVIICFLFQYYQNAYVYYFIPILILAISDPVAALIGKKYKWKPFTLRGETKTVIGSLSFFITALVISMFSLYMAFSFDGGYYILASLIIALITMIAEAMSIKGYDNLFIPIAAIGGLLIMGI